MGSSRKQVTGYNYHGGLAQAVCAGPVDVLYAVYNGDTVIYEGPVQRSSADGDGKTILETTIGTLKFYWGTDDQAVDADLAAIQIDYGSGPEAIIVPPLRGVCYAVSAEMQFGQQTAPPTLHFEVGRNSTGLSLSAHGIDDDAVLPEVIHEYLTNQVWGLGLDPADVLTSDFEAAAETIITEAAGFSPTLDANSTAREWIGKLLYYLDAVLYRNGTQVGLRLIRKESTSSLDTISEADLLDEPQPTNGGFDETWNLTRLSFVDRENKYEESVESYDDPANAAITGESIPKDVALPFIKLRSVAKRIASRIGIRGGVVPLSWSLTLKPSWKTLQPGDRVFLDYAKLGIADRLVRVQSVRRGSPSDPSVEVDVIEEFTRDPANDYTPPDDQFTVPSRQFPDGTHDPEPADTTPRLSWLPDDLKGGAADGILVACNRPDACSAQVDLWFTWDPAQSGYRKLDLAMSFPAAGQVMVWHRMRNATTWLLRVVMASDADYDKLLTMLVAGTEFYAVVGQRLVRTQGTPKSQHQALALWASRRPEDYSATGAALTIDIEVHAEAYSTPPLLLEGSASDQTAPTLTVFFGTLGDFLIHPTDSIWFERSGPNAPYNPRTGSNPDSALVRYIKCPVANPQRAQTIDDVTAVTYDRDLTTMCPDGTYSTDWGARSVSSYERLDFEGGREIEGPAAAGYTDIDDFDEGLRAEFDGASTDTQFLVTQDIDNVLGYVVEAGLTIHTNAP